MNYHILLSVLFLSIVSSSLSMELNSQGLSVHESQEENQCSVCFEDFNNGLDLAFTPCIHKFHRKCIEEWLYKGQTCPLCESKVAINELGIVNPKNNSKKDDSSSTVQQHVVEPAKTSRIRAIISFFSGFTVAAKATQETESKSQDSSEAKDHLFALQVRDSEQEALKKKDLQTIELDQQLARILSGEEEKRHALAEHEAENASINFVRNLENEQRLAEEQKVQLRIDEDFAIALSMQDQDEKEIENKRKEQVAADEAFARTLDNQ